MVRAAAAVAGLLLAGCAGPDDAPPPPPCPGVFVLGAASEFVPGAAGPGGGGNEGAGADGGAYRVEIRRPRVSCGRSVAGVAVDFRLEFAVERDAAGAPAPVSFRYFVALPGIGDGEGGRRVFDVAGRFEGDETAMSYRDDVSLFVPAAVTDTRVVVGIELSPEDAARSRDRLRRR